MSTIQFSTSDGEIVSADPQITLYSSTIRDAVNFNSPNEIIPLPSIDSMILRKILQWIDFHRNIASMADGQVDSDNANISTWEYDFLSVDTPVLFQLAEAADYLAMDGLCEMVSSILADMIRGKSPADVRRTFNIRVDVDPYEDHKIQLENVWAEDNETNANTSEIRNTLMPAGQWRPTSMYSPKH